MIWLTCPPDPAHIQPCAAQPLSLCPPPRVVSMHGLMEKGLGGRGSLDPPRSREEAGAGSPPSFPPRSPASSWSQYWQSKARCAWQAAAVGTSAWTLSCFWRQRLSFLAEEHSVWMWALLQQWHASDRTGGILNGKQVTSNGQMKHIHDVLLCFCGMVFPVPFHNP